MFETDPTIQDASRSKRTDPIAPVEDKPIAETVVDTTNLSHVTGTFYYPSATGAAMLPWKDLSFTGKIIGDATPGTVTITFQGTNDEDLVTGDWHDVTPGGYRPDDDTSGNASITVSNGTETFAIDFDNFNYEHYRVKVVIGASSTNTVIIKQRRKAL